MIIDYDSNFNNFMNLAVDVDYDKIRISLIGNIENTFNTISKTQGDGIFAGIYIPDGYANHQTFGQFPWTVVRSVSEATLYYHRMKDHGSIKGMKYIQSIHKIQGFNLVNLCKSKHLFVDDSINIKHLQSRYMMQFNLDDQ